MASRKKYGVWFHGRNTPVVVTSANRAKAIAAARRKGAAGSGGKVKSARQLRGQSLRAANAGRWVRESADGKFKGNGKRPKSQMNSAYRPHANAKKRN